MATGRYIPSVLGKPTNLLHGTQVWLQDAVKKVMTEPASKYMDNNPAEQWIDAFKLTATGYELTSCECLIPTIACRTEVDAEYRTVNSASTPDLMGDFKQLLGEQNQLILNALRRQAELQITAPKSLVGRPLEPSRRRWCSAGEGTHATDG